MQDVLIDFIQWYLVVQAVGIVTLPLSLRLFSGLGDRGYAFSKILGTLLVGLFLWLGTSYGLLRNEAGGAWLSLLIVGGISLAAGWPLLRDWANDPEKRPLPSSTQIFLTEAIFLIAFLAWTWVRAYDPGINHTEQPMDLMFMNGIWTSPTFPPRDPWMAGYAISYYYFGYWLLMTLARLAAQPPEIAYNLGQACWFGFLILGCFGLGYNLLAASISGKGTSAKANLPIAQSPNLRAVFAGLLTAATVGLSGNLQVILEWLHAQGMDVSGLANWAGVRNFPAQAPVTNQWFIEANWSWWWRASRVISDTDLAGNHIEVIDEFPIFSYVLGDNHPHVLAMPFVILVIGMLLAVWVGGIGRKTEDERRSTNGSNLPISQSPDLRSFDLQSLLPAPSWLTLLLIPALGGLVFLNTWDYPPYLALAVLVTAFLLAKRGTDGVNWRSVLLGSGVMGALLLVGTIAIYFPYFLTAQSQAGGIVPNFFNPTRLPQFLMMFGHMMLGIIVLVALAWREEGVSLRSWLIAALLVIGLPLLFLFATFSLASGSDSGMQLLQRMALPPAYSGYGEAILDRWLARGWTLLLIGIVGATVLALLWSRFIQRGREAEGEQTPHDPATTFALMLAGIGLLLILAPEFVYLRDNFGTRMNTVFKFYYQGWLLLGVGISYALVRSLSELRLASPLAIGQAVVSLVTLLLIGGGLIYPVAGPVAKIKGFGVTQPTLNGIAYVGADESAAIEWIRRNTAPDALVLQAKGRSYYASDNLINTATGRATLLGWDGHEAQWRGPAYGEMAAGRPETIEAIYRSATPEAIDQILQEQAIEYVLVGPVERDQYGISGEERFGQTLDLVFEQGNIRIYRRRG